jgi:hypothetical protein
MFPATSLWLLGMGLFPSSNMLIAMAAMAALRIGIGIGATHHNSHKVRDEGVASRECMYSKNYGTWNWLIC